MEVPYSNRDKNGDQEIDPRSYATNDHLAMSQSSMPTEDLNPSHNNTREISYIKKYKKAKK